MFYVFIIFLSCIYAVMFIGNIFTQISVEYDRHECYNGMDGSTQSTTKASVTCAIFALFSLALLCTPLLQEKGEKAWPYYILPAAVIIAIASWIAAAIVYRMYLTVIYRLYAEYKEAHETVTRCEYKEKYMADAKGWDRRRATLMNATDTLNIMIEFIIGLISISTAFLGAQAINTIDALIK